MIHNVADDQPPAHPAPMAPARPARHMVASSIFLCRNLAIGAMLHAKLPRGLPKFLLHFVLVAFAIRLASQGMVKAEGRFAGLARSGNAHRASASTAAHTLDNRGAIRPRSC